MLRKLMFSFLLFSIFPNNENIVNEINTEQHFQLETNFYKYEKDILLNDKDFILQRSFTEVNETIYTTTNANIRLLPDKESTKIATLPRGSKLVRIGVGETWSKILYENKVCYIHGSNISLTEPKIEEPKEEKEEPVVDISSCFVKKEGNVKDAFIVKAEKRWNLIPNNVRDFLITSGINIYVTDTNLAQRFYNGEYSSLQGVTEYLSGNIYLEDRDVAISEALIHECGHLVDYNLGWPSNLNEFYNLYESEKDSFRNMSDNHCISSSTEYFAEVFNQTILNPTRVKKFAPNTYEYMINLINNL